MTTNKRRKQNRENSENYRDKLKVIGMCPVCRKNPLPPMVEPVRSGQRRLRTCLQCAGIEPSEDIVKMMFPADGPIPDKSISVRKLIGQRKRKP